jgi:hypothetical protein
MRRLFSLAILSTAAIVALAPAAFRAQEPYQYESDLIARRRVFESVGAGFRAIHRGPNGNYYILTAPAPAIQIYDPAGKRVAQIPNEKSSATKGAALVYGESFDVDSEGRVAVCDRGANAVKIYSSDGSLSATVPVSMPTSVVLLPGGEVAVASPKSPYLIVAYDFTGKQVREYGAREEIADNAAINDQVNFGHLVSDEAGNNYFAFDYLPEPTARKYDHVGYLTVEIALKTLEFQPAAQSARRAIANSDRGIPALHRIITALGVDRQSQEIWLGIGTLLMHFDKDGERLESFRTFMPRSARLEASAILVEPDRILIGADPQGIYEFSRPARQTR